MKLNRKLNLVLTLDYGDVTMYVHASPISREVFEANYLVISKAFAEIHNEGLTAVTGPRVAYLVLKDVATKMGIWDGPTGVSNTLVAELVRRANVISPVKDKGWETLPFQEALDKNLIDDDDKSEVLNALTFFTVASSMYPRREQSAILDFVSKLWGGHTVSSNCSEFLTSLSTSTGTESSGEKKQKVVSSHPS